MRYLSKAEETSNLESEDEGVEYRPRKKFRKSTTHPDDESDEDSVVSLVQQKKVYRNTHDIDGYPNPYEISTIPPSSSQIQNHQSNSSPLSHSPSPISGKCNS